MESSADGKILRIISNTHSDIKIVGIFSKI